MFTDFGGELPLPTQIVVSLSEFVKGNILYILGAVIGIGIAFRRFYKTEKGRVIMDNVFLKLPIFGILLRKRRFR